MKSIRKTRNSLENKGLALLYLLAPLLLLHPACDCGGTSDNASATADDDSGIDDDTSADDDVTDDDAGTTTTTSPTTTTTGPTGTTTTTTSPTSTTTTTIPGSGTACDPYRYTAADGPDVPDFGPWPEYTIGQITYRQYISGSAGVGTNAVALDADGRMFVFGMVGRSFDAYVFDADGGVERQIVDPSGGMYSEIHRDAAGAFHVVYMNNNHNELRYATDASGEWVVTVLSEIPEGNIGFSSALGADGTLHIEYTHNVGGANNVRYLSWNGGVVIDEEVMPSDGSNWFWGFSVALDSAGAVHMVSSGDAGVWHRARVDGVWTSEQIAGTSSETDMMIDGQDVIRLAIQGRSGGLSLATKSGGAWTTETIDDCSAGSVHVRMSRDAAGVYHLVYPTANYGAFRHAWNAGGTWTIEQINGMPGYYLGGIVAPDGVVHAAAASIGVDYHTLYYTTNNDGGWTRRQVAGGKRYGGVNLAFDTEGALHMAFTGFPEPEEWHMYYIKAAEDEWLFEVIDPDAVDSEPGIAVDSTGKVHVVYVDGENQYPLKYAVRDANGWTVEPIYDAEFGGNDAFLSVDSNDRVSIGYTNNDKPLFLRLIGGEWYADVVPYEGELREMKSNSQSKPHMLIRTDTDPKFFQHLWKPSPTTWEAETAISPTNYAYIELDMGIDVNNMLHMLYCCDLGTGVGYASNQSGSWTSMPMGPWTYRWNANALSVDHDGSVHLALTDTVTRPGLSDGHALFYGYINNNSLYYVSVDDRWDVTPIVEMEINNNYATIAYEAFESICTATIDLEAVEQ